MRRSKYEHYVFSVYSSALGNYPYYPFVGRSVAEGIRKYMSFISNREYICDGAELHIIGTCNIYKDKINPECLVPYIIPKRVEIKDNLSAKIFILGEYYLQAFNKYLKTLKERISYGKSKERN